MADLLVFHRYFNRIYRRERVFRDRINPMLNFSDAELISRYRLHREGLENLIELLQDDISPVTERSHAMHATTKTLVTLRYLAKGDFFSETGDLHGVSKSSVSRAVDSVVGAINEKLHFHFPTSEEEHFKTKRQFHRIAGIPHVLGAIDGTLIPITMPTNDEKAYVCRKGYHALNVQAVVGPDLRFTDVVARWPGSQHDATIFEECGLRGYLERLGSGWLLGDSGYPLRKYLMTPKLQPISEADLRYNTAHSKTRVLVERAFGVLKSRFRCLHKSGGCLPFSPGKSCQVVGACMRLHNFCIQLGLPLPEVDDDANGNDGGDDGDQQEENLEQDNLSAQRLREMLINNL